MTDTRCSCNHLKSRHAYTSKGYSCQSKRCRCVEFKVLEEVMEIEETKEEIQARINKRRGLEIRKPGELSTREKIDKIDYDVDRIRKEFDIRNVPDEHLSWYQLSQKRRILKENEDSKT
jgi:hypothetical protein